MKIAFQIRYLSRNLTRRRHPGKPKERKNLPNIDSGEDMKIASKTDQNGT
jgi:hypothetical protein